MSIRALNSAASGMDAMQFKLDVIANNLANAGTTAFKKSRVNFEDVYYQHIKLPGLFDSQQRPTTTGTAVGLGTRVQSTQMDMQQGSLIDTGRNLDLAIVGQGFFQVSDENNVIHYTRAGNFFTNANGTVVLASADRGLPLTNNEIVIPQNAVEISVGQDGQVFYRESGQTQLVSAGQVQLARFANSQGLLQRGENLYLETNSSGPPIVSVPGIDGMGVIRSSALEASNTEPVRELVDLISNQRTFELNGQVIQAADQSLQLIANLRRF
jgi:flagellar basal-body rod protein FlgG